jgi:putative flippase GtrA
MEKYQRIDFRDEISKNKWKSFFLMFVIFVVIILLGYVISLALNDPILFTPILIFSTIISIFYVLISYYNSDKIALAIVGAMEVK